MAGSWDVLIVDDEAVVRDGVSRVLASEGLRVAAAEDGRSALAHEALGSCRLVLCDLMLPDMAGLDVLRALRTRRPGVAVVVITGYATAGHMAQALEAGATGFLPKPFDETELMAAVRHALGGVGPGEERES
ncbi:MAG TPA: response regulator [Vicinamibacteria bacterium]|nr:response regulator [Vicinamibacteria bacterium]